MRRNYIRSNDLQSWEIVDIKNGNGKTANVKGRDYYVKECLNEYPYLELVAERLLNIVDIPCLHYEAVRIDNKIYYLSEVVGKNGFFIIGSDLRIFDDNLWSIWYILLELFSNQEELMNAMNTIVKKYMFDILFLNSDGDNRNWAYVKDGDEEKVRVFDNEFIFDEHELALSCKIDRSDELASYHEWPGLNEDHVRVLQELEYFLDTWGEEYFEAFRSMVSLVPPEVVLDVIKDVEFEVGEELPKEKWLEMYQKNYDAITTLLASKTLKKKR